MATGDLADQIRSIERRRLRCLVEADVAGADALHAPDFELVHPSGGVWSKAEYLGGIATGEINYRRFEAVSHIEVVVGDTLAVLRYRSLIDIAVQGQEAGLLQCWHLDCYQRDLDSGDWRVRWSQATSIENP
jgi:hypothetical protein